MSPRAWSFLTIEGTKQYGGNVGYADDPTRVYRYDSDVANHRQVQMGDVAIIRSRNQVLGIAKLESVSTAEGTKERLRCPTCGATNIKERARMKPKWVCKARHTFDVPDGETVSVLKYEAHYRETFRQTAPALTTTLLNAAVIRPTDQMSIKEVDLARIEEHLMSDAHCRTLVLDFAAQLTANIAQISQQPEEQPDSIISARQRVLREISLRRGQAGFRKRLLHRYGSACQISRSTYAELVEAAHIDPYASTGDHSAHNGLLLRSDLHTLFDLSLLAIEPVNLMVSLHPSLLATEYAVYAQQMIFTNGTAGPSRAALENRWKLHKERLRS
jgi:putative restriction endonuclease